MSSSPSAEQIQMLPPYTASQLGPERAALAGELRRRLGAAQLRWPAWIDARPGRLQVILGDCSDPPLGKSAATLVQRHGELLLDGIAALGLITAAPRRVLCASEPATVRALRALCAERAVDVVATPAAYPACPEIDVPQARGQAYTVAAEQLVRIGALVRGMPAPRLCTVAGAVAKPQVLARTGSDADYTPAALVRLCGGAEVAAWVAVVGGALGGVLWPSDTALPADTSLCLILPAAHELVVRLRRGDEWLARARNACLSCQVCTDFCPVAQAGGELSPHRLMQKLATAQPAARGRRDDTAAAAACTGCGACSVMCPADLLPGAAVRSLAPPRTAPHADSQLEPPAVPDGRTRIPQQLVLARLGLDAYAGAPAAPGSLP